MAYPPIIIFSPCCADSEFIFISYEVPGLPSGYYVYTGTSTITGTYYSGTTGSNQLIPGKCYFIDYSGIATPPSGTATFSATGLTPLDFDDSTTYFPDPASGCDAPYCISQCSSPPPPPPTLNNTVTFIPCCDPGESIIFIDTAPLLSTNLVSGATYLYNYLPGVVGQALGPLGINTLVQGQCYTINFGFSASIYPTLPAGLTNTTFGYVNNTCSNQTCVNACATVPPEPTTNRYLQYVPCCVDSGPTLYFRVPPNNVPIDGVASYVGTINSNPYPTTDINCNPSTSLVSNKCYSITVHTTGVGQPVNTVTQYNCLAIAPQNISGNYIYYSPVYPALPDSSCTKFSNFCPDCNPLCFTLWSCDGSQPLFTTSTDLTAFVGLHITVSSVDPGDNIVNVCVFVQNTTEFNCTNAIDVTVTANACTCDCTCYTVTGNIKSIEYIDCFGDYILMPNPGTSTSTFCAQTYPIVYSSDNVKPIITNNGDCVESTFLDPESCEEISEYVCTSIACYLLEDCNDEDNIIYSNSPALALPANLDQVVTIVGHTECWKVFPSNEECICPINVTVLTTSSCCGACLPNINYKLTLCEDSLTFVYTSNDLSLYTDKVIRRVDCPGCWQVTQIDGDIPTDIDITVTEDYLDCELCNRKYYLLEDCLGLELDIITYTDLSEHVDKVITLDWCPETCWEVTETIEDDGAGIISDILNSYNECIDCLTNAPCICSTIKNYNDIALPYKYLNCEGHLQTITLQPNQKSDRLCLIRWYAPEPCNELIVTITSSVGIVSNIKVYQSSANHPGPVIVNDKPTWKDTGNTLYIYYDGTKWILSKNLTPLVLPSVYTPIGFINCNGDCDCPTGTWQQSSSIPNQDVYVTTELKYTIEYFGNCINGVCPPIKNKQKSVTPGYNTPGCESWKYEEISCRAADAMYKQVLELRYGISNCCPEEDEQYIVQKELIDLAALNDPTYPCSTNSCGCNNDCNCSTAEPVCPPIPLTYNCFCTKTACECIEKGDGSGEYSSLALCQENCVPAPPFVPTCSVLINNSSKDVSVYFPSSNTNIFLGNYNPSSPDIAHTATKLWLYNSTGIYEYNITLSPWSATFNRIITIPLGISLGSGLGAINNTQLISTNTSISPHEIIVLNIITGTAVSTVIGTLGADRRVAGDILLTTTNKILVTTFSTGGITLGNVYLTQYSYPLGTFEVEVNITSTIPNPFGIFIDSGMIYVCNNTGQIYNVNTNFPYTQTLFNNSGLNIGGASQVPSCNNANLNVLPPVSFKCLTGVCFDPEDGSGPYDTEAECLSFCTTPPQPSWSCVNNTCIDPGNGSGDYLSFNECLDNCIPLPITWTCNNGTCESVSGGTGQYGTLAQCRQFCEDVYVSFNCLNGECTDPGDGSGRFATILDCDTFCTFPPPVSFKCLNGNCTDPGDGSGDFDTEAECISVCTDPPQESWTCFFGECTDPGDGSGVHPTFLDCIDFCVPVPGVSYNCIDGNCIDPLDGLGLYPTANACWVDCDPTPPISPCVTTCDGTVIPAPLPGTTLVYSAYTITSTSSVIPDVIGFGQFSFLCNFFTSNFTNAALWPVWGVSFPVNSNSIVPFTYTINFGAPINNVYIYLHAYTGWTAPPYPAAISEEFVFTTDAGYVDITCTDYCCATITNGNTVTAMTDPGTNCPGDINYCPGTGFCSGSGVFIISSSLSYTSLTITGTGGGLGTGIGLCESQFGTSYTSTVYTTFDALPIPAASYDCVNCECVPVSGPNGQFQTLTACQSSKCINTFITTWETTTAGESITLPYYLGGVYSGTIDWGDSTTSANSFATSTHIYASPGIHTVTICGRTVGWNFNTTGTSALKIKSVVTWGQLILGANVGYYFFDCSNLDLSSVSDTLDLFGTGITNFEGFFYNCASLTTVNNINFWDTSAITSMESMFEVCSLFNQSLNFNTTAVTNMSLMFNNCFIFDSTVTFDTSLVTDMYAMFSNCFAFNSPVIFTNTALVQFMNGMFSSCVLFNQPLNFNTVSVTNMTAMFSFATAFNNGNQPLLFNTISVNFMTSMFANATAFQQNIGTWNISNVTNIVNFMLGKTPATWPQTYFNNLLCGWSTQVVTPGLMIHFGSAVYTTAIAQPCYDILDLPPKNWIINSGGGV